MSISAEDARSVAERIVGEKRKRDELKCAEQLDLFNVELYADVDTLCKKYEVAKNAAINDNSVFAITSIAFKVSDKISNEAILSFTAVLPDGCIATIKRESICDGETVVSVDDALVTVTRAIV